MNRSRLRNIFLKDESKTSRKNCNEKKKNSKKPYFETLDTKKLPITRHFRRPFCLTLHRYQKGEKLKREMSYQVMKKFALLLKIFCMYTNLNIPAIEQSHSNLQNTNPILATVNSYGKHLSIERINNRSCNSTFSFKANSNKVSKIIDNLNIKKACQSSDIPTKIIKLDEE